MTRLRCITYLAPSLPATFFQFIAGQLGAAAGMQVTLECDPRTSGPVRGGNDPFATDSVDIGFVCAPSYLWLTEKAPASIRLLGAAPVFDDPRLGGVAALFADIIVRQEHPARSCADLAGALWAYNDPCSLSGWFGILQRMAELGQETKFVGNARCAGTHLEAIDWVRRRKVHAAAIDSNVLQRVRREQPLDELRIVETLGPFPVQPIVVRRGLPADLDGRLVSRLLALHHDPGTRRLLDDFGVQRFAPVDGSMYEPYRVVLRACEARLVRSRNGGEAA